MIPTSSVEYVHLPAGGPLPSLENEPRRVVVLVEQDVDIGWQTAVSDWIVNSGCLFLMAWGRDCSSWDDSVDIANLEQFDFGDIPDEHFVMTTWHDEDTLEDMFVFCLLLATCTGFELPTVTILHISSTDQSERILKMFETEKAKLERA